MDKPQRLSRMRMFSSVAWLFGQRSSCPRASVGAIAVLGNRVVSSGYVGAPSGQPHCLDVGCEIKDGGCIRTVHAEANVIAWAARKGVSLEGAEMYCTHSPCVKCAQLMVNAGISHLVYQERYRDLSGETLLLKCEVTVTHYISSSHE